MDTPFVRQYTEDRELTAWLLLDRSPSMGFGPIDRPKELVLCELATTFARLLTRSGNRVGAILFDNEVEEHARAARAPQPGARADAGAPAPADAERDDHRPDGPARVRARRRSGGARSSFSSPTSSPPPGWERPLLQLTERHEVVAIRLSIPASTSCPTPA